MTPEDIKQDREQGTARLVSDCRGAAKVMMDMDTFQTGQGILTEAANTIAAQAAEIDALKSLGLAHLEALQKYLHEPNTNGHAEASLIAERAFSAALKSEGE